VVVAPSLLIIDRVDHSSAAEVIEAITILRLLAKLRMHSWYDSIMYVLGSDGKRAGVEA
jgi:hypothetical protein